MSALGLRTSPLVVRNATHRLASAARAHLFIAIPFMFYWLTCARGIGMSDNAILVGDILDGRISAAVNSHNLGVVFGRAFTALPIEPLAYRANLMSVFFGGLAVSLFYALVFGSFGSRIVAAMTASLFMVSQSMWWHSTIVESYAINACFVIVSLLLLDRHRRSPSERNILGLIGLAGISLFQHAQLGVIGLAAVVVAAVHVVSLARAGNAAATLRRFLAKAAAISALSLTPYALALASDAASMGGLRSAVSDSAGGPFKEIMFRWAGGLGIADTVQLTLLQFPSPFIVAIPLGFMDFLHRWGRTAATAAVLMIFVLTTVFFAFFHTWDRFAFLLPSFIVLAFWGSFAVDQIVTWARESASRRPAIATAAIFLVGIAMPPWMYARMASWNGAPGSVWALRFGASPSSNTIDAGPFVANPNKRHYRDIDAYFGSLFATLPPNAVYVEDDSRYYTLEYYRFYERRRPDLQTALVNSFGFTDWGLTRESFQNLTEYAYAANLPFFLPTIGPPFGDLLAGGSRVYHFEVETLDAGRYIYRLVTATDEAREPVPPFLPVPRGMHILRGRDPLNPNTATLVERDEDVSVRLDFEENSQPFPVVFRWIAPDDRARFSSPINIVPAGSGAAAWIQERRGILVPGRWRVEATVGTAVIASASIEVR